jgi:two-component system sporulation sensor kinase A
LEIQNQKNEDSNKYTVSTNLELLFETHPDAVCVFNLQGDIIYANQAVTNLLGYSKLELLKMKFIEVIASDGIDIFNYYFQKAVMSDTQEYITPIKCKDGRRLEMKIVTVSNEIEGQIVSVSGFISDITEQSIDYEVKIQTSMELCESFIENNRDPILLLDLDAIIVLANRSFSRLLGWPKENLEGFHILQCPSIPPHLVEQMRDYYYRVVNSEENLTILDTIRMNTEGKTHYMMLSITPIHERNGDVCNWAVHLRDITAQKETEQSLLHAEKLLALGQISTSIADGIRTPLLSIKGFIQTIKTTENETAYNDSYLNFMIDELNRIEIILNDLSSIARTQERGR